MKISLLLCGQMRTFDHPKVNEYINKLIDKFDCDVFVSTWKDRGVSLWSMHSQDSDLYSKDMVEEITPDSLSIINNVVDYNIEDFGNYETNICQEEIKPLIGKGFSQEWSIRANSNPQFYTMHIASEMKKRYEIKNNFTYDVVIKSRPDFLQVHNDIEKYFDNLENTCYHINTGISYSANRVYDVYLMSDSKTMDVICNAWNDYIKLVNTNHAMQHGQFNACRLLYAQCLENDIDIVSFDKVLGDNLRIENYSDYQFFENLFLDK